jgi:hypothetical protein
MGSEKLFLDFRTRKQLLKPPQQHSREPLTGFSNKDQTNGTEEEEGTNLQSNCTQMFFLSITGGVRLSQRGNGTHLPAALRPASPLA